MPAFNPNHIDWAAMIADRNAKWEQMKTALDSEGLERIDIWGNRQPENGFLNGFRAGLYIYPILPGEPKGIFIICAGGGFRFKSSNEAKPVAEYFRNAGFNTAILDYTVDPQVGLGTAKARLTAGEDARQAIRYLRANADKLGIRGDKIAVGGFSAGGMTSQCAAAFADNGDPNSDDPIARVSSRPDTVLLLYGAFSDTTSLGMLGYVPAKQNELARYDPIRNIGMDFPPTFIFQTNQDDPRNALTFAMELAARGIPHEVHSFISGPHGAGLYNGCDEDTPYFPHTAMWAQLAANWLDEQGFR